jgi:hypothetical protein
MTAGDPATDQAWPHDTRGERAKVLYFAPITGSSEFLVQEAASDLNPSAV